MPLPIKKQPVPNQPGPRETSPQRMARCSDGRNLKRPRQGAEAKDTSKYRNAAMRASINWTRSSVSRRDAQIRQETVPGAKSGVCLLYVLLLTVHITKSLRRSLVALKADM